MKNMKKVLAGIFAGLTITAACACGTANADNFHNLEHYYPAVFIITDASWDAAGELQILTAEDATGHIWRWYSDAGDWTEGDMVAAIMYDMETECIYDDIMIDERYVGIPEWYSDPASRPTGEPAPQESAPESPAPDFDIPEPSIPDIDAVTEIVPETEPESTAMVVGKCEVKIPAILGEYLA